MVIAGWRMAELLPPIQPQTEEKRLEGECYRARTMVIADAQQVIGALSPDTVISLKLHRAIDNLRDALALMDEADRAFAYYRAGRKD